jgi:hypothetical protein
LDKEFHAAAIRDINQRATDRRHRPGASLAERQIATAFQENRFREFDSETLDDPALPLIA